jgi:thioredoxin 1
MINHVTESTYQTEVQDHAGRVLIDFYTPTCPPCRAMAPVLDQIAAERADKLKIVKIDASTEYTLTAQAGVSAVPTFVLMNGGVKKAQLTGLRSKKDFEKWLDEN